MAPPRTRARVKELLDEVKSQVPIRSTNTQVFDKYHTAPASPGWNEAHPDHPIHTWQDRLMYDWYDAKPPRGTTCCNQFAGQIILMAGGPNLAGISLRASLDLAGSPYAWVPNSPTQTARPRTGDVLDFGQHIGLCYNKPGGEFGTLESGQGGKITSTGPHTGYDMVDVGKSPFSKVIGWADLDLVFSDQPDDTDLPSWLHGWWTLTWQETKYWYCFHKGGYIQYQKRAPANSKAAPVIAEKHDSGSYTMTGPDSTTVRWRITGSIEKWTRDTPSGGPEKMTGVLNGRETMHATKLT